MNAMKQTGVALVVALCGMSAVLAPAWGQFQIHSGMCDASAGIASSGDPQSYFVANDEDQGEVALRLYSIDPNPTSSGPLKVTHVSASFLELKATHQEVDVEGAARIGDDIYWIGSHSASNDGKPRPNRRRLFATREEPGSGGTLIPFGKPYKDLIEDLENDDRYKPLRLAIAGLNAPKDRDALSIEGLAATADGGLLIGFRNPIPEGNALLVPLKNPGEVVAGKPARFGDPIFLNLGGFGIRSIEHVGPERYLIVAGRHDEGGRMRLFSWTGAPGADAKGGEPIGDVGFNAEALFLSGDKLVVLSDDGNRTSPGHDTVCKALDETERTFRSLTLPAP
jgi:hypothetical protein